MTHKPALSDRIDTWFKGEAPKPTVRERKAMELALDVLRGGTLWSFEAETKEDRACDEVWAARHVLEMAFWPRDIVGYASGSRATRARLALWLRARLRSDLGGGWVNRVLLTGKRCVDSKHRQADGLCLEESCGCAILSRRIMPMWEKGATPLKELTFGDTPTRSQRRSRRS